MNKTVGDAQKNIDVSIVMINYNTFDLTKEAIESIFEHTSDLSYEIILIDNLSPDGSGERLREHFGDEIVYLQAGGNLGTAKSFNKGVDLSHGKYILWLNTDILLFDNAIFTLFDYMENHPECGICGGNLIDFDKKPMHSFAVLPTLKSVKKPFSVLHILRNKSKKPFSDEYNFSGSPMEVGYITGADMMVRKSVIDDIGGFDEDIFMYAEETEFTFRMKKNTDFTVMSVPAATIQHLEGASFGKKSGFNEWRFSTYLNGMCVYFKKCYGADAVKKYLNTLKRSYRKMAFIFKLRGRAEVSSDYKQSHDIVVKKIEEEKL